MMLIKELRLKSEEDMFKLAKEIANELTGKEVICLKGNLGAGKTTFVKGLGITNLSQELSCQ